MGITPYKRNASADKEELRPYLDGGSSSSTGDITRVIAGTGLSGGGKSGSVTINLNINGLTAQGSPTGAADYVAIYDAGLDAHRKVLLNNLPATTTDIDSLNLASPATNDELMFSDTSSSGEEVRASVASVVNLADHDQLTNFDSNEHVDHTGVSLTAGDGLTGGGTIASTRTFTVGAGDGISVAADAVAVDMLGLEDLTDPGADRVFFWDDGGGASGWLAANDHIEISGTNLNVTPDSISFNDLNNTSLADPGADRIVFWDDSDTAFEFLTAGDGLDIAVNTMTVDVTDFIDTSYGLTENSNNIRINIGDGLEFDTGALEVDLSATSGLEFSSADLQIADSIAGDGLTISSKVLAVGAGDGISVAADAVAVDMLGLEDLTDPGADRIFFWDDGGGASGWLVANTGLEIDGTNLNCTVSGGAPSDAQYWVGAADGDLSAEIVVNDEASLYAALSDVADFVQPGDAAHDGFSDFVANEHINHTSVTLTAGTGLTGGGDISSNRTFNVDVGITDNKILQVNDADAADNDYAKFTTSGIQGRSYSEVLGDLSGQASSAFDWNGQNLTNVGTVDGVDVSNHHDRHDPEDGADALDCGAAGEIVGVTAAAEGSAHSFARSDHTHQIQHAITNNHIVTVDGTSNQPTNNDYAKFTSDGLEGKAYSEVLSDLSGEASSAFSFNDQNITNVGDISLDTISSDATNITIQPTGDVLFNPTGNDVYPTNNYDLDLGQINKKWLTLHAAELWVETLVAQDTIATIGGRILVGPTTTLVRDFGTGDTTIYVEHNEMVKGDTIYMEANSKVEFMSVDTGASAETDGYSYPVTRDVDSSGVNQWYAGDAAFNTGQTGDGFIDLYSVHGVDSSSMAGPSIVGNVRNSTTYNDWSEHWAIGNLNSIYGYGTDTYGVGLGKYANGQSFVTIDETGGYQVKHRNGGSDTTIGQWDTSGNVTFGEVAANKYNLYWNNSSGDLHIRENTTSYLKVDGSEKTFAFGADVSSESQTAIIVFGANSSSYSGETFDQGDMILGDPDQANLFWDVDSGRMKWRGGTTTRLYVDTDGSLVAGGGDVLIDDDGITLNSTWGDYEATKAIKFGDDAYISAYHGASLDNFDISLVSGIGITMVDYGTPASNYHAIAYQAGSGDDANYHYFYGGGVYIGLPFTAPPTNCPVEDELFTEGDVRVGKGLQVGTLSGDQVTDGDIWYDGQLLAPDGSVSDPSITFDGDPDSGLYNVGADNIGLALGGTKYVEWDDPSGNDAAIITAHVPSGATDFAFAAKSTDVAHGYTDATPTIEDGSAWFWIRKLNADYGGGYIFGGAEDGYGIGLYVDGYVEDEADVSTTQAANQPGVTTFRSGQSDGSGGMANFADNKNIFAWRNGSETKMILQGDGELAIADLLVQSTWDEYDDIALIEVARHIHNPDIRLRARTKEFIDEHRRVLEETGVFTFNDDGCNFMSVQNATYLLMDALRQVAHKLDVTQQELVRLGGDPEKLMLPHRV